MSCETRTRSRSRRGITTITIIGGVVAFGVVGCSAILGIEDRPLLPSDVGGQPQGDGGNDARVGDAQIADVNPTATRIGNVSVLLQPTLSVVAGKSATFSVQILRDSGDVTTLVGFTLSLPEKITSAKSTIAPTSDSKVDFAIDVAADEDPQRVPLPINVSTPSGSGSVSLALLVEREYRTFGSYNFDIPPAVPQTLKFMVWGAGGGGTAAGGAQAGAGGYVEGTYKSSGVRINIIVGDTANSASGYSGGGSPGGNVGGGYSGVFLGGSGIATTLLAAGGGGALGVQGGNGGGGGAVGEDGEGPTSGKGAGQMGPGVGGGGGATGTQYGAGWGTSSGGGAGNGWFGGGGADGNVSGGGGGSSHITTDGAGAVLDGVLKPAVRAVPGFAESPRRQTAGNPGSTGAVIVIPL